MSNDNLTHIAEELGRSLCRCASGQCDLLANDPGLCRTLIKLLAQGQPVSADSLAQAAVRPREDLLSVIKASGNVALDGQGRVVGAGLSLQPTPHKLSVDDRLLYAWCALDALMYPPLLEMKVQVESPCAATGTPVRVRVSAAGVDDVAPAAAVVSVVRPDDELSVRQGFCSEVHFFASAQVAAPWLNRHPHGRLLSVTDAYQLGQRLVTMQS